VKAGTGIEAGRGIKAGQGISCERELSSSLRIFAGLCIYKKPNKIELKITCGLLVSGEICFGNLIETGERVVK